MHRTPHLNERQALLLERIASGGPPVTSRESGIALSVYALRSRGLVSTPFTAGIWNAVVTDTGRFYLEHGTYPDSTVTPGPEPAPRTHRVKTPAAPPPVMPTTDLVARIRDAGGTLRIVAPGAEERAHWRRSIQAAIRSGLRCHYTGRLRGDIVVTLSPTEAEQQQSRLNLESTLAVTKTPSTSPSRTRTHPLVTELRALAANAGTRPDQRLPPVGRSSLPRALRILNLLLVEAERRGHSVQPVGRSHAIRLTVHGFEYSLALLEYRDNLSIKLTSVWSGRRFWSDGTRNRLEHKIEDVLACLEARTIHAEERRAERERAANEHAQAQETQTEQLRARFLRERAVDTLREHCAAWSLAADIRAMCADMHQHIAAGQAPATNHAWITWASAQAEALDPTHHPLNVPHIPPPTAQDLARYLTP